MERFQVAATPDVRAGPVIARPPGPLAGPEVGEDGHHPAVLGVVGRQAELGEHVADVLLHRAGRDHQPLGDGRVGVALGHQGQQLPFPRGQGARALSRRCPASSWDMTCGSSTVAPRATRSRASRNSPTLATRSFSR